MACQFGSPDLVTSLSGVAASPTFAFDAANSNHLGIAGSFTSNNGAVCSFPTRYVTQQRTSIYAITPIIVTIGRTTTCSILAPPSITPSASGSTTYSGFECPSITDNQLAPGTYTLRFNQPNVAGAPTISSRTFIVASPTFSTDRTTTTVFATTTAPIGIPSTTTSTVIITGPVETDQTVTQTVTNPVTATTTLTDVVSSCAPTPSTLSSQTVSPTSSAPTSTPTATLPVSNNGQCGAASGQTCLGSISGSCCSSYGFCGSSDIYCLSTEGCQSDYGECTTPSPASSTSPAAPTSTSKVSLDGTCGGDNGYTCPGSGLGDCCSPYGWCGSTDSHCGAGCQNAFGTCISPTQTGTAPLPTSTLRVSLNGACGGTTGQTCTGSTFGTCCSEYGYCGSTELYCTGACQSGFGTCSAAPARRAAPKANLRAVGFAAVQRVRGKREVGGAGPDYTYPPVPRTTSTATVTQGFTVVPTAAGSTVLVTTTVVPVVGTATVSVTVEAPVTTETVRETQTVCPSNV